MLKKVWVSIGIALLLLAACSDSTKTSTQTAAAPQAIAVKTQILQARQWQGHIKTFGAVEAAEEIKLSLDFSGIIQRVLVNEGERIKKGQLLIELDQEKRQLKYRQASEYVIQTKAALDETFLNLERRQSLADQKTVSREVLDNAKLAVERSRARYREAIAARQLAQRELNDSKVYSPVNGVVDISAVEPGENVQAGTILLTLQAVDTLRVLTWVSEKDINLIRNGASATIELTGLPGQSINGTVESVGINAHPQTGNFPVKLLIDQYSDLIRPGMTASVTINGLITHDVLILPESALVDRKRKRVVFVVDSTDSNQLRALRREPLLSAGLGSQLFILSGLQEGDRVIVSSLSNIVEGSPVTLID